MKSIKKLRAIANVVAIASAISDTNKSIKHTRIMRARTEEMKASSRAKIAASEAALARSLRLHKREIEEMERQHRRRMEEQTRMHAEASRRVEEMARVNKLMDENDASFDSMMAAIHDPNLSEDEKVAAVKAYQPKFR